MSKMEEVSLFEIISLIISAGSFIFAVFVPVRIANRQDKIALFDKRLSAYLELMKIVQFSDWLKNGNIEEPQVIEALARSEKENHIITQFCLFFNCDFSIVFWDEVFDKCIVPAIEGNRIVVGMIPFLYGTQLKSQSKQVVEELTKSYKYLNAFLEDICTGRSEQENKII